MKTVRLKNDLVVEVIPEYALPVAKWYGAAFAAQCIEAPDEVDQNWIYDPETETWTEPVEPEPVPVVPTMEERVTALESASAVTFVVLAEAGSIDDVTASEHADLFAAWDYPIAYKVGNIREHGGKLYRCLTAHTSQESWTPDASPSLWVAISDPAEEWPAWSQPIGSTDSYAKGDKVSHNGKHWASDYDANVWEPGVYGWTEVTE